MKIYLFTSAIYRLCISMYTLIALNLQIRIESTQIHQFLLSGCSVHEEIL